MPNVPTPDNIPPADGLIAVVKRDCPTCVLTAPVLAELARLGGSDLAPEGGPQFQFWRRWLGWRLARRLQLFLHR